MTPQTAALPELSYHVDAARLGPLLGQLYRPLQRDAATESWLTEFGARPHSRLVTGLVGVLSRFRSLYDVHGWLGVYPMHLLSEAQFKVLLGPDMRDSLLDVGAGAGYVTLQARGLFREVTCTETSPGLSRRLRARGFLVRELDVGTTDLGRRYDTVCCLNVLDRTARPVTLLSALLRHVVPGGRLVLSVPLPVSAHVQVAGATVSAQERLPAAARGFEEAARELTERVFLAADARVCSFSRVPYLSRGDSGAPYYVLDAGIWVLAP